MNSFGRIGELVPLLEKFEFPYCDAKHENVKRDAHGNAISDRGHKVLTSQCPLQVRFNRPACNHCEGHERDPLSEMAYELQIAGKLTPELREMAMRHMRDLRLKTTIDTMIREARTGTTRLAEDVPSIAHGEQHAMLAIETHRQIVDRMRILTAKLLEAARA